MQEESENRERKVKIEIMQEESEDREESENVEESTSCSYVIPVLEFSSLKIDYRRPLTVNSNVFRAFENLLRFRESGLSPRSSR